MVGVPQRAKCHTCRRKKIKCDEAKPSCGQCRKSVVDCQGYDMPAVFKSQPAPEHSEGFPANPSQTKHATDLRWRRLDTPQQRRRGLVRHGNGAKSLARPGSTESSLQARLQVPPPMPRSSWSHDSLVQDFLDTLLPSPGHKRHCVFSWFRDVACWKEDSDVTRLALTALATGWAGRADGRPDLVGKGLQMYGVAATGLRRDIPECPPPLILATAGVLIAYELFEYGLRDNAGCLYHLDGARASAQAAGTPHLAVAPYVHIYGFFRFVFMLRCMLLRRPPKSAEVLWLSRPENSAVQDDEFMSLIDLGFEAARLLEMADLLELSLSHSTPPEVVDSFFIHLVRLVQWKRASRLVVKYGPVEAMWQSSHAGCGLKGFPGRIGRRAGPTMYDSVHDMRLMQMYYALRLVILATLLSSPVLRAALDDEKRDWSVVGEKKHERLATSNSVVLLLQSEGDMSAAHVCTYAHFLCPTLGPTMGYMLELWALERAGEWYGERVAGDNVAGGDEHRSHMNTCLGLISIMKRQMETV